MKAAEGHPFRLIVYHNTTEKATAKHFGFAVC